MAARSSRRYLVNEMISSSWLSLVLSIALAIHGQICVTEAAFTLGICFGMMGNNIPPPPDVVALYKKYGVRSMRLFDPNPAVLQALKGSQIDVALGVLNNDIPAIASSQEGADRWFAVNVEPYLDHIVFPYITVGNEVVPGEFAIHVAPAITNLQNIINARKIGAVKVTTVVSSSVLGTSFPPSAGAFSAESREAMITIIKTLSTQGAPLLANVYPYFAYAADPVNIRLDYAQFTAPGPVVQDGNLSYQNIFDAILDAFYSAMEREGVSNVDVVVSETGWPSAGNGNFTTPDLAHTYNKNFVEHVSSNGTPKRPRPPLEGYIFSIFNENSKSAGVEQHFGLFDPPMQPVYPFFPRSD